MANHKSAKKSIRQIKKRSVVNRNRLNRMRTFVRKVEEAIATGSKENAQNALREAQSELMKGVGKSLLKKNAASRKVSRLSARIKVLAS